MKNACAVKEETEVDKKRMCAKEREKQSQHQQRRQTFVGKTNGSARSPRQISKTVKKRPQLF